MTALHPSVQAMLGGASISEPLAEYPWVGLADQVIEWAQTQNDEAKAFAFDLLMSLAYIDSFSVRDNIQYCENAPDIFNTHQGFINLCACCFQAKDIWQFQKASKPKSAVIGKLTSELVLRFVKLSHSKVSSVLSIGGTSSIDAVLIHQDGRQIISEVKASPLLTYPLLLRCNKKQSQHSDIHFTNTQIAKTDSALYLHNSCFIPLGLCGDDLWPFKKACDFIVNPSNIEKVQNFVGVWSKAKNAYEKRNKEDKYYFLANASGRPPSEAITRDGWPKKESISDGKTSAGLDRTDDIKKGIYQTFKLGATAHRDHSAKNIKTALISNLPAYRHKSDYIDPLLDTFWAYEDDIKWIKNMANIQDTRMFRPFDYLITLIAPMMRKDML